MKPVTKLQIRVKDLSDTKLPKITDKQEAYAFKNNLPHIAVRLKSGKITCLDCGHSWQSKSKVGWHDTVTGDNCPNCNVELKIEETRKRISYHWSYMHIITTCEEFQVIRLCKIRGNYKSGEKPSLSVSPVSEIWMAPNGKYEIVGFNNRRSWYGDGAWWTGGWELKRRDHLESHNLYSNTTYPEIKVHKIIRRNGFKNSFHNCKPYDFIRTILSDSKAETLFKSKQYGIFTNCLNSHNGNYSRNKYWREIKICIRNKYVVKDPTMWYDYLEMCEYFKIDYAKAEICCPKNLKEEHNRLLGKKREIEDERRRLQDIKNHEAALKRKKEQKAFFGKTVKLFSHLSFTDKDINIQIFKSVKQLKEESILLDHCAYSNQYHLKLNSLLLSATHKGVPVETIQVCLKNFQIIQARGYDNDPSKYHKDIVVLMNKNMRQIKNVLHPPQARKRSEKQAA